MSCVYSSARLITAPSLSLSVSLFLHHSLYLYLYSYYLFTSSLSQSQSLSFSISISRSHLCSNAARVNVALSRARHHLLVLGNGAMLVQLPLWSRCCAVLWCVVTAPCITVAKDIAIPPISSTVDILLSLLN